MTTTIYSRSYSRSSQHHSNIICNRAASATTRITAVLATPRSNAIYNNDYHSIDHRNGTCSNHTVLTPKKHQQPDAEANYRKNHIICLMETETIVNRSSTLGPARRQHHHDCHRIHACYHLKSIPNQVCELQTNSAKS